MFVCCACVLFLWLVDFGFACWFVVIWLLVCYCCAFCLLLCGLWVLCFGFEFWFSVLFCWLFWDLLLFLIVCVGCDLPGLWCCYSLGLTLWVFVDLFGFWIWVVFNCVLDCSSFAVLGYLVDCFSFSWFIVFVFCLFLFCLL